MNLELECSEIDASANRHGIMEISLRGCDSRIVLDHFTVSDVVGHFGESEILDYIGTSSCKTHFDLKDNDE